MLIPKKYDSESSPLCYLMETAYLILGYYKYALSPKINISQRNS